MSVTPGRIVHYQPVPGENGGRDFAWPAMVTYVHRDGRVDLTVFRDGLLGPQPVTQVAEGTEPGTWRWPARA